MPPSSPQNILTTKQKEYSPEDFGLDWKTVYTYREKMFSSDEVLELGRGEESDGLFLYQRRMKNDSTGKENGGWYFSQVPGDGEYSEQITEEEKKLFGNDSILKLLAKYDVFIEYGPGIGEANKLRKWVLESRQFTHFRKHVRGIIRHLGLDASTYTADQFNKEYQNNTAIHGECIPTEWSKSSIPKDIPNAAHIMLGGTPGAYSRRQLVQLIRFMSSGSNFQKSPLLLSFFSAPQEPDKQIKIEQIKDAYRCDAAKNFVMKGIKSLGFPIDDCEYAVEYQEGSGAIPDRIIVGAKLKKDITIDVGGGKQMTKKAGEYIRAVASRRYTDEQFIDILEEAGTTGIKLHGEGGIKVAESYLPRKEISPGQRKWGIITSTVVGSLLALFIGLEVGKHIESKKREKKQEKQTQELKLTLGCTNDVYFNQLLDEILNDMEVRYGNNLTQEQKILLTGKVLDFFSSHQTLLSYGYGGGQGMMYSTNLYTPSMMNQFIAENANLLLSMRLNIVPNNRLLENGEALMNSYYYQGERQEFSQVDIQLSDYVSEGAGVEQDGKPYYFTYPCGIKIIHGVPYFVVKRAGADGYMLEEKTPNLHSNSGLCAGDIVTEIITRGQAQVFAERIQDFLELRYGDKMVASMNGQDIIASYLIDLQAQGRNLGFLFGTTNDLSDPYRYLRDSPLHDFVLTYLLPVIGNQLVNGIDGVYGSLKMYNIDTQKIAVDQQKMVDLSKVLPEVYDFLSGYISKELGNFQDGKVKSAIMKQLLLDPDVSKLDITDKQSIRARLTIHAKQFNNDGITVPEFPDRIDTFLAATSGPTYSASDDLQGISGKDAHAGGGYDKIQFGSYTDIKGNDYDVGVYQVSFLKYKVVARVDNQFSDEDLIRRWQEGEFGEIQVQTPRGNYTLTQKSSNLLDRLKDKAITYSSSAMHQLMADYKDLKASMEKFKK